jgi:hypothetical protein
LAARLRKAWALACTKREHGGRLYRKRLRPSGLKTRWHGVGTVSGGCGGVRPRALEQQSAPGRPMDRPAKCSWAVERARLSVSRGNQARGRGCSPGGEVALRCVGTAGVVL